MPGRTARDPVLRDHGQACLAFPLLKDNLQCATPSEGSGRVRLVTNSWEHARMITRRLGRLGAWIASLFALLTLAAPHLAAQSVRGVTDTEIPHRHRH